MKRIKSPFVMILTILLMAVQPSYSAAVDPSVLVNPLEGKVSEEGIARLTLPTPFILSALKEHLVADEAHPERYLKKISKFEICKLKLVN